MDFWGAFQDLSYVGSFCSLVLPYCLQVKTSYYPLPKKRSSQQHHKLPDFLPIPTITSQLGCNNTVEKNLECLAKINVNGIYCSPLISKTSHFIIGVDRFGQTWLTLGKSMLTLPSHFLLLPAHINVLWDGSLHDLSRNQRKSDWLVVLWPFLNVLFWSYFRGWW